MVSRAALSILLCLGWTACGGEGSASGGATEPRSPTQGAAAVQGDEAPAALPVLFPPDGRPRRALLVGVSKYHPDTARDRRGRRTFEDLPPVANDIRAMHRFLTACCGFAEGDVRVLLDEAATLEAVVGAIRDHLIVGVQADTEVVLFFAGHGSRVHDAEGLESGDRDATWVLYDSRVPGAAGRRDLDDDALHSLLAASPSEHITVITDCCHSGDATRSVEVGTSRRAPEAPLEAGVVPARGWSFWPQDVPLLLDGDPRRAARLPWVHVAACGTSEEAFSRADSLLPIDGASGFGNLTHALLRALYAARPGESWTSVGLRTRHAVARHQPGQTVWVRGPAHRRVFGATYAAQLRGYPACALDGDRVRVDAGVLRGLAPGMECEVVRLSDRAALGRVLLDDVRAGVAFGAWVGAPAPSLDIDDALWLTASASAVPPLQVRAAAGGAAHAALRDVPWVRLGEGSDAGRDYRVDAQEVGWSLLAPDGFVVWPRDGFGASASGLAASCRQEAEFWWLWGLGALVGQGGIDVSVEVEPVAEGFAREGYYRATLERLGADTTSLAVPVAAPWPAFQPVLGTWDEAYLVVLDLDRTTRHVAAVWPPKSGVAETRDGGGKIGSARAVTRGPLAGLAVDAVSNRLLALGCDRPLDMSAFLFQGQLSRGTVGWDGIDPETWGIAVHDLVLRPAK